MARSKQHKLEGVASLADTNKPNTNSLLSAGLFTVSSQNTVQLNNSYGFFLLNPAVWEEHKSSNWVQHPIPGESDPILQWTSGGARTITVEALVTKDHAGFDLTKPVSPGGALIDQAINAVGNIASAFLGITIPAIGDLLPIGDQGQGEELSIADNLNYYRSLMYPDYKNDKTVLSGSPPLVALFAGKTFSKFMSGTEISIDTDLWVVTDLRIKITKQLPNLAPMEATVGFTLVQYNRRTKSQLDFSQVEPGAPGASGSLGDSLINSVQGLF